MQLWMRKIFVFLITFVTLGMYVPPNYIYTDAAESNEVFSPKEDSDASEHADVVIDEEKIEQNDVSNSFISVIKEQVKEQSISKLGPRIAGQVDEDFMSSILPNMEEAIEAILAEVGNENIPYYAITEQPTPGYGEKIFDIYDFRTKKDVARFHIRRDNRPGEGYWFNFHYHLSKDGFEKHHSIGEIYWDKNTPPKWMS
ncbi:YpjP family protein [Aquibacillus sp. 3ASR75-11]|uniref:YpjP family protein n=1 Tax=Terrihalobacillus insolitus TaxID=2950438 RepID=A0A9X3WXQ6_9BACI|nr:YpjP family protein [Terrihalobacillus insolitus]MDC3413486.1 YpjP family protein [Terrihalobacillus insolitus]MDC3425224.1 YpjP family protein [Terrihalobacillus insolitus]